MHWTGFVAAALGVPVLLLGAAFGVPESSDKSMEWEGRVAVAFLLMVVAGPIWLAQGGFTLAATLLGDGTGLLWVWWVAAPLIGATPPAQAVVRLFSRRRPGSAPDG